MNWEVHQETDTFAEYHESEAGRVEHCGPNGWDAWVYIPSGLRVGHATKHKVGECYLSAASAKAAVIRQYRKYAPLRGDSMSLQDAIARNRARQAAKHSGEYTPQRDDGMRAFTVNVAVIPTALQIALGLANPIRVGEVIPTEKRTIYGTSLADAKRREGIE